MIRIERCLIDANWGSSTDVVYQFCRQSAHASVIMPSHGRFVGASSQPFSEYKRRPGDRVGLNWRMPNVHGKRAVRHVVYDTNYWKSFVHARLAVAMGDRGCLSLFGDGPDQHRLLAEHLSAEYRVKTEGRGRTVDEWKLRPERGDNHWFDCLVGCAVGASMQGVVLNGTGGGTSADAESRQFRGAAAEPAAMKRELDKSDRGLRCPRCGCRHFYTTHTEPLRDGRIRRRKECRHCGRRIVTYESAPTTRADC